MYKIIEKEKLKKINQYNWFSSFSNPCYGFDVMMDVTNLYNFSKQTNTKFFINMLYIVVKSLNTIEEFRMRQVKDEIRLYDTINPTFTVMTNSGVYENTGFKMIEDYQEFYQTCERILNQVKNQEKVKETYNDNNMFDDYYITCIPWLEYASMTHPLPDNNLESSSCPRICWNKYKINNEKVELLLNITVSHAFVDGYPLSMGFKTIQENLNNLTIFK